MEDSSSESDALTPKNKYHAATQQVIDERSSSSSNSCRLDIVMWSFAVIKISTMPKLYCELFINLLS